MKPKNKVRIAIAFTTAIALILTACIREPPPPLRVGTVIWPGYENFYLARDLGYYTNTPIQLLNYPSCSELLRAYRNKEIEVATATMDEVLVLATTHPNTRIVLAIDTSQGADAILAKPPLKRLQELKGRRVGVESSASGAFVLTRAFEQASLSAKEVEIIPMGISEHERAFQQGDVDAVVTFEPVRSKLLAAGANSLFDSTKIPGEIVDVLIVRQDVLTEQQPSMQALIDGWFRAFDYFQENPQDAALRVAPREGVTPEQFLQSLKGLRLYNRQDNQALLNPTNGSLIPVAKRLSQIMVENRLLPQAVDPTPLLDNRLVENTSN